MYVFESESAAPLSEDKFLADVDGVYKKYGRCLIAVSEGVGNESGKTWAEAMSRWVNR